MNKVSKSTLYGSFNDMKYGKQHVQTTSQVQQNAFEPIGFAFRNTNNANIQIQRDLPTQSVAHLHL
jgi:hypothetical protein